MGNPQIGLRPCPDTKGLPVTRKAIVSASSTTAIAQGSAIYIAAGVALATPATTDGTEKVTGSVVRCLSSNGNSVQNIPATPTAGAYEVEFTFDPDQRYAITVSGTGIAAADLGKFYSLTAESLTANTNGFDGDGFSKRQIDSTTEGTSAEQFIVQELSGAIGNAVATDDMEVIVTINPVNYASA